MAVTVTEEAGGTILTDGTEQTVGAVITAQGIFFLRLDLNPLAGGTTPDIIEIREKLSVRASGTVREIEGSAYVYQGGLSPQIIETPQRVVFANQNLTYTIKRVQGTDRTYTYAVTEIG